MLSPKGDHNPQVPRFSVYYASNLAVLFGVRALLELCAGRGLALVEYVLRRAFLRCTTTSPLGLHVKHGAQCLCYSRLLN